MRQLAFLSVALVSVCAVAELLDAKATEKNKEPPTTPLEETAALMEWAAKAEAWHKRIAALQNVAAVGGEAEDEALARYQMLTAKARLAFAQGQLQECERLYATAVDAAVLCVRATEAAYNVNTVSFDRFALAQQQVAEAKVALSRIRQSMNK